MSFLLLAIACSVLLGFTFKVFVRKGVHIFQAIVFNYFTCFICGWIHLGHFPITQKVINSAWLPYGLLLGLVFISGFNTAALTVRHFGVTISQVMQKMSILMSVPVAVWVFGEEAGNYKVIGFILALGAIVMVNLPAQIGEKNRQEVKSTGLWWIPLVTWILAGVIEVVFLKVQHEQLADINDPSFIIIVFGTAGVLGLILAAWGWINGKLIFEWKNVLGGIILGVPNYGSMLFMLWALAKGLGGSIVFPVNNVGIIVVTAIGAVLIFQERLTKWNWLGVGLAATAIYLMAI